MTDVTVPVPENRVAEFYKFFSSWLEEGDAPGQGGAATPSPLVGWSLADEALAASVWDKLTKSAKALLGVLIDQPTVKVSAISLAEQAGIAKGHYGVAGVLGAPSARAKSVGRGSPVHWGPGEEGGPSVYWMDAAQASCFKAARDAATAAS